MSDIQSSIDATYAMTLLRDELSRLIEEGTEYTLGKLGESNFERDFAKASSIWVPIWHDGHHHAGMLKFFSNQIETYRVQKPWPMRLIDCFDPPSAILYCDPDFFVKVVDFVRNL